MTIPMTPASDIDRLAALQTEARNEGTADIDVVSTVEMMGESLARRVSAKRARDRGISSLLPMSCVLYRVSAKRARDSSTSSLPPSCVLRAPSGEKGFGRERSEE